MVVEMKVQYCREKLKDSFYTNETCLQFTIFKLNDGEILQTNLRSYLKIVHCQNVSPLSHESQSFSLKY